MYAIQIQAFGNWIYVMDATGTEVMTFETREIANRERKAWQNPNYEDKTRVVEYPPEP